MRKRVICFFVVSLLFLLAVGCARKDEDFDARIVSLEIDRKWVKGQIRELNAIAQGERDTILYDPSISTQVIFKRVTGLYARLLRRAPEWPLNYVTIKVPFIVTGMIVKPSFYDDAKWWVELMAVNQFYLVGSAPTIKWLFVTPFRGASLDSAFASLREKGLIKACGGETEL